MQYRKLGNSGLEVSVVGLGTNNFGEIRNLVSLVKTSQIFITNIQPTHLIHI